MSAHNAGIVTPWRPQFGEVVVNTLASKRNPLRTGLFVKVVTIPRGRTNAGRHWELTDGKGEFWMVRPENCEPARIDDSGCAS